jgi:hypothetical protein
MLALQQTARRGGDDRPAGFGQGGGLVQYGQHRLAEFGVASHAQRHPGIALAEAQHAWHIRPGKRHHRAAGGSELGIDREVKGVTGLVRYDLTDSLTLSSVSAWRTFETAETFDPDGISLPILTGIGISNGDQFSQELRLNWDNGGQWSGFVGAGYFREDNDSSSPIEIDERIALAQLAGILDGSPTTVGTRESESIGCAT